MSRGSEPPTATYREIDAKSITRLRGIVDPWFLARYGMNLYRGCEHGCVYCYARPSHEYLGMSAGLDFESRILVKEDAPRLLRRELSARAWRPRVVAMSGVTDPYQPIERKLEITRRCLEVLVEFRNPVAIITKNGLVARDEIMTWCESNGVEYVLGLARNARLVAEIAPELEQAREQMDRTGRPARRYKDFRYRTLKSWSRERRVVGKAEQLRGVLEGGGHE